MVKTPIVEEALYTAPEVARILGIKRIQTVYAIPAKLLPKVRVGPTGGLLRYKGSDILEYINACRERVA